METVDFIQLRALQVIAFDDMAEQMKSKSGALKSHAEKPNPNQDYIDRENKFMSTIHDYINITERLISEIESRKQYSDDVFKDAITQLVDENDELLKMKTGGSND